LIASLVLALLAYFFSRGISLIPSRFQLVVEGLTDGAKKYVDEVLENKKLSDRVFPLILSLFVFILFLNLFKFLPGTESITYKGVQFLKPVHSDLNMTIALALVAWFVVQIAGVAILGF
jgi:F0F1-type ATP synthase membrane subunit a